MTDGDHIEPFQIMDRPEALSICLQDTEPLRPVRRVRGLVNSGVDLPLDDLADLVVDSGWNGDWTLHPDLMRNHRNVDRREVFFLKLPSF